MFFFPVSFNKHLIDLKYFVKLFSSLMTTYCRKRSDIFMILILKKKSCSIITMTFIQEIIELKKIFREIEKLTIKCVTWNVVVKLINPASLMEYLHNFAQYWYYLSSHPTLPNTDTTYHRTQHCQILILRIIAPNIAKYWYYLSSHPTLQVISGDAGKSQLSLKASKLKQKVPGLKIYFYMKFTPLMWWFNFSTLTIINKGKHNGFCLLLKIRRHWSCVFLC